MFIRSALVFFLALGVLIAPLTATADPEPPEKKKKERVIVKKDPYQKVKKSINRTKILIKGAKSAIIKGKEGKELFRKAVVHQRAARKAREMKKNRIALDLTLKARKFVRQAMEENDQGFPGVGEEETKDNAAAEAEVEGELATVGEAEAFVMEENESTPSVDYLLETDEDIDPPL